MYPCIKSIADSQAALHANKFRRYAVLIRKAAAAGGELDTEDTTALANVLAELQRGTDDANQDLADLIELAQLEPIAAGLADAQRAYDENVAQDRQVFVAAQVRLASINAEMFARRDWISVGEVAELEKLKDTVTGDERNARDAIQNAGRVLAARLTFVQDAGRRVAELRAKHAAILATEPVDATGENGDGAKAAA